MPDGPLQIDLQQCNSSSTPCLRQVQTPKEVLGAFNGPIREAKNLKGLAGYHNQ